MKGDRESVTEWFVYAAHDLDTAALLLEMRPQHFEIICYHCEQAAEKYLKGYLVSMGTIPPKTHDLDQLCELCSKIAPEFDSVAAECAYLSQFSAQPRYPYEMELSSVNTNKAYSYAKTISELPAIIALL